MKTSKISLNNTPSAFTIIELLVVIVIIAILAAVTLVAYTGISQEAIKAALKSDLANAATSLKAYNIENSAFPNSISDCPTPSPGNTCLRPTSGNSFSSYSANNTASPKSFSLTASNGSNIYIVTSNSNPVALAAAPLNPVADWLAMSQGDHYGNYYDLVTKQWATVTRATPKTIYDPATNKIYDVPANYLGINPRSDGKAGSEAVIEEGRTNYLLTSDFEQDSDANGLADNWSEYGMTSMSSKVYTTPNDTLHDKAQKIAITGSTGASAYPAIMQQVSSVAGDVWTFTCFAKVNSVSSGVSLSLQIVARDASNAIVSSFYSSNMSGSSWAKYTVSATMPTNTAKIELRMGSRGGFADGSSYDISLDAAQVEKGAFATSYIPTTTAAVTRNADSVTVPTGGWSVAAGTAFAVAGPRIDASTQNQDYLAIFTSTNDRLILRRPTVTTSVTNFFTYSSEGITSANSAAVSNAQLSYHTAAGVWGTSTKAVLNGSIGTDAGASRAFTMKSTAELGKNAGQGIWLNGSMQRLSVYSSALSDSDVGTVTNAIKDGLQ